MMAELRVNRLQYLAFKAVAELDVPYFAAREAVSSIAIEHPEWDTTTLKTISEWDSELEDNK